MTSSSKTSDTLELRTPSVRLSETPDGLPEVPGGWAQKEWTIEGHVFRLILPASPDDFLDDADVHAAFDRDEYMPYWAYLWPASLKMVATILRTPWIPGTEVLELGAGIGLVGLAGLAQGLKVTFSDYEPKAVDLALYNAGRAGFTQASGMVLDWRQIPDRQFPLLWGCELLYEDRNHKPLLELTQKMLAPGGTAWFVDGGRAKAELFCNLVQEAGLTVRIFDEQMQPLPVPRVGRYQLIEVQLG
ncbi:MAG: methyltransferase [Planctomycetes bacterium]|nr:methyltransferase [Planctomycetota bacterium]